MLDEWRGRCVECGREFRLQLSRDSEPILSDTLDFLCPGPMCGRTQSRTHQPPQRVTMKRNTKWEVNEFAQRSIEVNIEHIDIPRFIPVPVVDPRRRYR